MYIVQCTMYNDDKLFSIYFGLSVLEHFLISGVSIAVFEFLIWKNSRRECDVVTLVPFCYKLYSTLKNMIKMIRNPRAQDPGFLHHIKWSYH